MSKTLEQPYNKFQLSNLKINVMKKQLLFLMILPWSLAAMSQTPYYMGIFQENPEIVNNIEYKEDLVTLSVWNGFTDVSEFTTPFYGDTTLAYVADTETWNGMGITSDSALDFSSYITGFLHVSLKIPAAADASFRIAFKDHEDNEYMIQFPGGGSDPYSFERNDEWQEMLIPVQDFVKRVDGNPTDDKPQTEDLEDIRNPFMLLGNVDVSIDEIWWAEGDDIPDGSGLKGVFTDHALISDTIEYIPDTISLSIWNGFTDISEFAESFFGENVLSYVANTETWNGMGITSQIPLDFSAYINGYMHVAMKIPEISDASFRVAFKDQEDNEYMIQFPGAGEDPFNFVRNDEWHELIIPIQDFIKRVDGNPTDIKPTVEDLEDMRNPFMLLGNVDVSIDEIWYGTVEQTVHVEPTSYRINSLGIYPNPANNFIYIKNNSDFQTIEIFDLTGKSVMKMNEFNQSMINISNLKSGLYLIKTNDDEGVIYTDKFLKK